LWIGSSLKGKTFAMVLTGILAIGPTTSHAVLGDQILEKGMAHEDVQVLQKDLMDLGYFKFDSFSNTYDENTSNAVKALQINQNIEMTGIFDEKTFEAYKFIKDSKIQNILQQQLVFTRKLSLEAKGGDVIQLQEALKALELLDIDNCTDYYGVMTETAVKAFQNDNSLIPNGVADLRTIETLNIALGGRGIALPIASRGATHEVNTTNSTSDSIAELAKKFVGSRYVSGGMSPKGFDCSGFTSYVYKQQGITLPRTAADQAYVGTTIIKANLMPGDLLIFSNTYKAGPSHTGIYIGNGRFVHASTARTGVIISDLNSSYYTKHFTYGKRLAK